ncbi:transcriptional regulator, AlpA family [Micromonospora haikouensis]|uniref:Transcriptional regulator, AlpA family n=2 Tax=Micromonospora haikouensis TaxID=686309 RepID=A0A1C4VY19_9ACTN|nr:transcriptional regulator, AlpA family [Micromonospora haikouensis]
MLGVGRSRLRQIIAHPKFPPPFQTLQGGSVWLRSDVEAYIRDHRRARPAEDEDTPG